MSVVLQPNHLRTSDARTSDTLFIDRDVIQAVKSRGPVPGPETAPAFGLDAAVYVMVSGDWMTVSMTGDDHIAASELAERIAAWRWPSAQEEGRT